MQKSYTTQRDLLVFSSDLDHPILHCLHDTEALLDWSEIELLLSSIYASTTGRPSYPPLSLFRSLLLGVWYELSDRELA
ncbi:MAG: IS5 family transposase [Parvicella sp.]|jgi:IS5 family transposase